MATTNPGDLHWEIVDWNEAPPITQRIEQWRQLVEIAQAAVREGKPIKVDVPSGKSTKTARESADAFRRRNRRATEGRPAHYLLLNFIRIYNRPEDTTHVYVVPRNLEQGRAVLAAIEEGKPIAEIQINDDGTRGKTTRRVRSRRQDAAGEPRAAI